MAPIMAGEGEKEENVNWIMPFPAWAVGPETSGERREKSGDGREENNAINEKRGRWGKKGRRWFGEKERKGEREWDERGEGEKGKHLVSCAGEDVLFSHLLALAKKGDEGDRSTVDGCSRGLLPQPRCQAAIRDRGWLMVLFPRFVHSGWMRGLPRMKWRREIILPVHPWILTYLSESRFFYLYFLPAVCRTVVRYRIRYIWNGFSRPIMESIR